MLVLTGLLVSAVLGAQGAGPGDVPAFKVREGYKVTLAADVPGARFMEFDDKGRLYVSRPYPIGPGASSGPARLGSVIVLWDPDKDGVFQKRALFVEGRAQLHALCWHEGWMYYAFPDEIRRARDTDGDGKADQDEQFIATDQFPSDSEQGHWWRSLLVNKDGVYTSVGDSGNITDEAATERQKIWKFDPQGKNKRPFAAGLRNTEKLRVRPGTSEIWGLDHGSDWFGKKLGEGEGETPRPQAITDWNPPEEINLYREGEFYGHPFITGYRVPRYEYADRADIVEIAARTTPPEWTMPAHWAGNGFCFIDAKVNEEGKALPKDHGGDMFACYHGSWNRSEPGGYCVVRVLFDPQTGKPYGSLKIVDGLAGGKRALVRPVDAAQAPDGTVLFSCDLTGKVFRIRAKPELVQK